MKKLQNLIENNLNEIILKMEKQTDVGAMFPDDIPSFSEYISQLHEFVNIAGEYGLAYEFIIGLLEEFPFLLDGPTVVKLVEVALLFKYKSDNDEDLQFDSR